jgi:serine/threonine-protein kinase
MGPGTSVEIDNRYEVLSELGHGGMGVVYKAKDSKMGRLVAIKVMTAFTPGREEVQERFLREAKSIAKMHHPNIVVVYDYGRHNGAPYIAMEYVEGLPLDKVIASRANLSLLTKVDLLVQVCQALHYAHQQGIVHRDVKPGNIMLLENGKRVKLLDFGIARDGAPSSLSKSGQAMGTTPYMSPEQTKGQKDLDARSDIFSVGVVLYEVAAGRPPWTANSDYEVMTKIIQEPAVPLSSYLRDYPRQLDRILERALAKDPAARYQTAEEMAQDLSELQTPLKDLALEEAHVQCNRGEFLRASDLVSQILRIDTHCREAIELRNRLQYDAQVQQRTEQIRQLRTAAEEAVGQKNYTEALAALEQAISLDSTNTEIFHYRELIRQEMKRREDVRKKLELAKRAQEINDISTAQELVDKALEVDPTDTQARVLRAGLELEKRQQLQQEIAEDASRALAGRAFTRARELIQNLERVDPNSPPLMSLRQRLRDGEAEEQRRAEIEGLVNAIRNALEANNIPVSLSLAEQALARFPGEPRLNRLRAQAESVRDATERMIQKQLSAIKNLAEKGHTHDALAASESALQQLGPDQRLQAVTIHLRQALENEGRLKAEQAALARARDAVRAGDYESGLKILTSARVEFPSSKEIADGLQALQDRMARHQETAAAENARKREIAEALEHALAGESDPEAQVRLAAEANRKVPGNDDVQQILARVREHQQNVQAAEERALELEKNESYWQAILEWENIRQLYPQHPQAAARIAECNNALKTHRKKPTPVAAPAPALDVSATKIMAGGQDAIASSETPVEAFDQPETPVQGPDRRQALHEILAAVSATWGAAARAIAPRLRSRKLQLALAGLAVVVIAGFLVLLVRHQIKAGRQPSAQAQPSSVSPAPPVSQPAVGALVVETNLDEVDVLVDGVLKDMTKDRKAVITLSPGPHSVAVEKPGVAAPEQQATIVKDAEVRLSFELIPVEAPPQSDQQAGAKKPSIVVFSVNPDSLQQGQSAQLQWETKNAKAVTIKPGIGPVDAKGSQSVTPTENTTFEILVKGEGRTLRKTIAISVTAPPPKPVIRKFEAASDKIQEGQTVKLAWATEHAEVSISPDPGQVDPIGSVEVKPARTTVYELTAKGPGGTETSKVHITVEPAPAPTPAAATVPAAAGSPEISAVKETIEVRFKNAYESRDINELKKVWHRMSKETEKEFSAAFDSVQAVKTQLTCSEPVVKGNSAKCTCSETVVNTYEDQRTQSTARPALFQLQKSKGIWYVVSKKLN